MLAHTISQYLASHRRLVVPQLGAFIVKEPGVSVVFSELLRSDDGVLRALLREGGYSELEAAGQIDRFVFEVRHAIERGVPYGFEELGVFRPGVNGTISFECKLHKPSDAAAKEESDLSAAKPIHASEQHISQSVLHNPDPALHDLHYRESRKPRPNRVRTAPVVRHRGIDRFLWIAVIAAAVAVMAIAFGYYQDAQQKKAEMQQLELPAANQPAATTAPADEAPQPTSN